MAKRAGTAGKASRRAASADPGTRPRESDSEAGSDGGSLGGVKDSKRRVRMHLIALVEKEHSLELHKHLGQAKEPTLLG